MNESKFKEVTTREYRGTELVLGMSESFAPASSYDLSTLVAASLVAKDINGTYVKRGNEYRNTDPDKPYESYVIVRWSNRDTILILMANYPELVEERLEEAKEFISTLETNLAFKALSDHLTSFEISITEAIANSEVSRRNIGCLAYAPYYVENEIRNSDVNLRATDSKHLGVPGDKLTLILENIRVVESRGYPGYNVSAITNTNDLVSFFTSKNDFCNIEGSYRITAKIKSCGVDWKTKSIPETRLNYVKIV